MTGITIQNIHTVLLNSNAFLKSNISKLLTALVWKNSEMLSTELWNLCENKERPPLF